MTEAGLIGLGGALGAGCRYAFGRLLARAVASPLRDLGANVIGPTVVVLGVHAGLAPTLASGGRVAVATGALGGYMLVSTLRAAESVLSEGTPTLSSLAAIVSAAVGCLAAGAIGLGLARCCS